MLAAFFERLASFARVICFDKRGTGLSDRVGPNELPGLDVRMEDLTAVMDAAGSRRATLMGHSEGGALSIVFAATHPDRVERLILVGAFAKRIWSPDYPWAPRPGDREAEIAAVEESWGDAEATVDALAPSRAHEPAFVDFLARYMRQGATPRDAAALLRMNTQIDTTSVLSSVQVPTLCIYRTYDADVSVEEGRWIASQIPDAVFVEIEGHDHWIAGEGIDEMTDAIEEFITGSAANRPVRRMLTTMLFTDIVGSTETAARLGDEVWRAKLERHHDIVRRILQAHGGREVSTAGDGFLATFEIPGRALTAAHEIVDAIGELGLQIRAGVHTGEVELTGEDIAGLSVHVAARIADLAGPGEVLASRTVRDICVGGGFFFQDRGAHTLKGVPDRWHVFAVGPR